MSDLIYKEEAYKIIGACMEVYNTLGPGFLESVYQEALAIELEERGIPFVQESAIAIRYKGRELRKKFYADFLCYEDIIVELKAQDALLPNHEAQVLNYLKGTEKPLGLLVNFGGSSFQYKRFANTRG
ncbi:MAG: GxxExxY protein [Lewinellaceae bacterium]|nr:GxxExxY protein [Phaeodactylibacter sp.]MCB9036097.1 GxxExxY protein [Lewinellaceae bacterium]